MAYRSAETRTTQFNENHWEYVARWLSCNGEVCGVGPTAVFASAAALSLYHELQITVFNTNNQDTVSVLEKTLVVTMVTGMLALMVHLWVCSMRFFQYYLDALIKDSPSFLLEMTTASIIGDTKPIAALAPLTKFLHQQQPQIHITLCWFLSLCYADYVRKHYCQRFNLPYLEQWQMELQERASSGVHTTIEKMSSFVGSVQQRLRSFTTPAPAPASPPDGARNAELLGESRSELVTPKPALRGSKATSTTTTQCRTCLAAGQACVDGGLRCGSHDPPAAAAAAVTLCSSCRAAGQVCVDGGQRCSPVATSSKPVSELAGGVAAVSPDADGQRAAYDKVIKELQAYCESTRCECDGKNSRSSTKTPPERSTQT